MTGRDALEERMTITAQSLPGPFGAMVNGPKLTKASDDDLRQLMDLLLEHRFIVIPGQSWSNDEYLAFGRRWGRPVLLVSRASRVEGHPEIIRQSNSTTTPQFFRNNTNHWHCDSSYEEEVATFTMLYGVESPNEGGVTQFADLVGAYQALPTERRLELDGLQVQHETAGATALPDETISDMTKTPPELAKDIALPPPVTHPLVQPHPVSGRKSFYGLGGSCCGIVGRDRAEANAMLLDLRRHAVQPEFVAGYKLMPGDLMIWDNFSVMHRSTPIEYSDEPGKHRLNFRISVKGTPPFAALT